MPTISTRAGRIHHVDRGDGPPVVMLHATLHDHHDFDAVVEPLSAHHRTIALDWPGHGGSDAPAAGTEITAPLLADAFEEVMTELDLGPVVIIGSSVGGFVAARFALDHPDRVAGLVMVNASGFIAQNVVTRRFCRTLGHPAIARRVIPRMVPRYMRAESELDRAIVERAVARARTPEGARIAAGLWASFALPSYDLRDRAHELRTPTMFVWGARDPIVPLRAGRQSHAAVAGSTLVALDTGHVPFASRPERFLQH
ncbi:MAG: alpha/beta fold hydrolase, partial [Acidimicrobiales bacterium]